MCLWIFPFHAKRVHPLDACVQWACNGWHGGQRIAAPVDQAAAKRWFIEIVCISPAAHSCIRCNLLYTNCTYMDNSYITFGLFWHIVSRWKQWKIMRCDSSSISCDKMFFVLVSWRIMHVRFDDALLYNVHDATWNEEIYWDVIERCNDDWHAMIDIDRSNKGFSIGYRAVANTTCSSAFVFLLIYAFTRFNRTKLCWTMLTNTNNTHINDPSNNYILFYFEHN